MTRLGIVLALVASAATLGTERSAAEPRRTVLVELFTSQGCSSCPAADRLLSEIGAEGLAGVDVIPLSFHVDYWNYIGWTDPFSAAEWSSRQRRYAARFENDRVYTPQLVIDGVRECVGAYRRDVRKHVQAAAERAGLAQIELAFGPGGAKPSLAVSVGLEAAADEPSEVLVALLETGLETEVGRGENARRTLHNDHVVRRLLTLGSISPGEQMAQQVTIEIDPEWRRDQLGVVVFVQSIESLEIHGAAIRPLPRE